MAVDDAAGHTDSAEGNVDYDGNVVVGGPAQVRDVAGLVIAKIAVGPMNNNAYLLRCVETGEGLLIDAAAEADRLADFVRLRGSGIQQVLTTHRHRDHWSALSEVVSLTGSATLAGAADADQLPVPIGRRLEHEDVVKVGRAQLQIIALRGHTPGAIAVRYDEPGARAHLFTGDSLFPGGVGRTGSPADFTSLLDDVEQRVFRELPDDTWIYPGHGADTTLGAERPQLPEWRARGW